MAPRPIHDRRIFSRLEPSCLYPDEAELAILILGPKRSHRWPEIVMIEERHGFPRFDPLYGGREWQAIVDFYERRRRNAAEAVTDLHATADERDNETWGHTKRLLAKRTAQKAPRSKA